MFTQSEMNSNKNDFDRLLVALLHRHSQTACHNCPALLGMGSGNQPFSREYLAVLNELLIANGEIVVSKADLNSVPHMESAEDDFGYFMLDD